MTPQQVRNRQLEAAWKAAYEETYRSFGRYLKCQDAFFDKIRQRMEHRGEIHNREKEGNNMAEPEEIIPEALHHLGVELNWKVAYEQLYRLFVEHLEQEAVLLAEVGKLMKGAHTLGRFEATAAMAKGTTSSDSQADPK